MTATAADAPPAVDLQWAEDLLAGDGTPCGLLVRVPERTGRAEWEDCPLPAAWRMLIAHVTAPGNIYAVNVCGPHRAWLEEHAQPAGVLPRPCPFCGDKMMISEVLPI